MRILADGFSKTVSLYSMLLLLSVPFVPGVFSWGDKLVEPWFLYFFSFGDINKQCKNLILCCRNMFVRMLREALSLQNKASQRNPLGAWLPKRGELLNLAFSLFPLYLTKLNDMGCCDMQR